MINHNKRNIIHISETTLEEDGSCDPSCNGDIDGCLLDLNELDFIFNQKIVDHKFPTCKTKMWSGDVPLARTRSKS